MNKDITPKNEKNQRHGYWEYYWFTSNLMYKCVYYNGKENGFEELCYYEGKLKIKTYYL